MIHDICYNAAISVKFNIFFDMQLHILWFSPIMHGNHQIHNFTSKYDKLVVDTRKMDAFYMLVDGIVEIF